MLDEYLLLRCRELFGANGASEGAAAEQARAGDWPRGPLGSAYGSDWASVHQWGALYLHSERLVRQKIRAPLDLTTSQKVHKCLTIAHSFLVLQCSFYLEDYGVQA